jgi:hypothetical protein
MKTLVETRPMTQPKEMMEERLKGMASGEEQYRHLVAFIREVESAARHEQWQRDVDRLSLAASASPKYYGCTFPLLETEPKKA